VVPLRLALVQGVHCSQAPKAKIIDGFRDACREFRKDSPFLALSVRELSLEEASRPIRAPDAQGVARQTTSAGSPLNRHKAITLAFENAALDARRKNLQRSGPEPDEEPESPVKEPSGAVQGDHMRQLYLLREDNARLQSEMVAVRQRLANLKRTKTSKSEREVSEPNWGRTLDVMQNELEHCRTRQRKIQTSYDQRLHALRDQLAQCKEQASSAEAAVVKQSMPMSTPVLQGAGFGAAGELSAETAALQESITKALARRDELRRQLEEGRRVQEADDGSPITRGAMLSDNPEAKSLVEQSEQYKVELASLQKELALAHERECGSERQQQLRQQVQQLYDQLDELHQIREDERVRSESEIRELRKERDACRDRLDDATAELRRLRAKAETLRDLGTSPGSAVSLNGLNLPPSVSDLARLQAQVADQAQDLSRLQGVEEARKATVAALEREQEMLVEKIGVISSQAMLVEGSTDGASGSYSKVLEAKAMDLERQIATAEASCTERRLELDRLRSLTAEALTQTDQLRQSYDELQKSADERVLRIPHGFASMTASSPELA